ncbi:MAG: hypothetical protein Q9M50_02325 [Methylococcales bacterium]|nr:hypothetical protein [Methylococcales bacterium]
MPQLWDKSQQHLQALKSKHDLSATNIKTSIVYPLDEETWVTIAIPDNSPKIRIISNAHIDEIDSSLPDTRWSYSLEYQILAADESVLNQHIYHQRAALTAYQKSPTEFYYGNHYASDKVIVLDGRMILVGLQGLEQARFIRIRLNHRQADIKGVVMRAYAPC